MKLKDILRDISVIKSTADMDMEISSVAIDSRRAAPGSLFVAMTGFETDGHLYIPSAAENGAAAVVCEKAPEGGVPYVMVENSRAALAAIGANFYGHPEREMTFIGVTGTNGKTTTTYLMKSVLEQAAGAKVGLIGTNQNLIGEEVVPTERTTPESLELFCLFRRMADAGCTHVVMEVSSHALCLHRVDGIRFRIGIFTNLTEDHLDFHKTMEAYRQAKELLFCQSDVGIINLDDPSADIIVGSAPCRVYTYSVNRIEADLVAKDIQLSSDCVKFQALTMENIQRIRLNIPGQFSVYNALGVIAASLNLGIALPDIAEALKNAKGVKGRVEVVPTDGDYTILIDYAHTPDALENVLNTVRGFAGGRVVVLFGCGGDRDPIKRPIMGEIAVRLADKVIITSDNPRTEDPEKIIADIVKGTVGTKTPLEVIPDRIEAIHRAIDTHKPGDVIVLAGKGHETYQIVGKVKHHMDEREIVADYLALRKK